MVFTKKGFSVTYDPDLIKLPLYSVQLSAVKMKGCQFFFNFCAYTFVLWDNIFALIENGLVVAMA